MRGLRLFALICLVLTPALPVPHSAAHAAAEGVSTTLIAADGLHAEVPLPAVQPPPAAHVVALPEGPEWLPALLGVDPRAARLPAPPEEDPLPAPAAPAASRQTTPVPLRC